MLSAKLFERKYTIINKKNTHGELKNLTVTIPVCDDIDNQVFKIKGTNCGRFCADLLFPEETMRCEEYQKTLGCYCKEGYYRDKNLRCVKPEECGQELIDDKSEVTTEELPTCPAYESYDNCSSRCLELCRNRNDPMVCSINCDEGCFCQGYRLRNDQGICVPINECEPLPDNKPKAQCPYKQVYLKCGNKCQELCPNIKSTFGMAFDCDRCEPGCYCESGLLISNNNLI